MALTRRQFALTSAAAALATPLPAVAQGLDMREALNQVVFGTAQQSLAALDVIKARGNPDMAAGLIKSMRFARIPTTAIDETLVAITGETSPLCRFRR